MSFKIITIALIIVVLPVPGPPVIIKKLFNIAPLIASFWSLLNVIEFIFSYSLIYVSILSDLIVFLISLILFISIRIDFSVL